jgi:hypothetical protein
MEGEGTVSYTAGVMTPIGWPSPRAAALPRVRIRQGLKPETARPKAPASAQHGHADSPFPSRSRADACGICGRQHGRPDSKGGHAHHRKTSLRRPSGRLEAA